MNNPFVTCSLGKNITDSEISQLFASANNANAWQRVVFKLARELGKFPELYKNDEYLVKGCETKVWLVYKEIDNDIYFLADSESRVLRGLLAVLLIPINGTTAADFSAFEQNVYLSELPLKENMTSSEQISLRAVETEISTIFQGLNLV